MEKRIEYWKVAPEGHQGFGTVKKYVTDCGLEHDLVHMVYLRVSQINGCAYCVDLHYGDAVSAGVDRRKLNSVVTWQESPFFSDRERAAFHWAETLTEVARTGAPDADYRSAKAVFTDRELVDLSYAVALMNAFNRIAVGFRRRPILARKTPAAAG